MKHTFTLREMFLATTVLAFASIFVVSTIRSNRPDVGGQLNYVTIERAVETISPQARRWNRNGRDGSAFVRLCFEYDVPGKDADDFLALLKTELVSQFPQAEWQHPSVGAGFFENDIEEFSVEKNGIWVDVALYLLDDAPSPKEITQMLGPGYRRLRFVVTRHSVRR